MSPQPGTRSAVLAETAIPFAPPAIGADEIGEVVETLESGWLSTGPRVASFERAFAEYTRAEHAIAVNSCTAALHLSLRAGDVGQGHEVITTPLTFCAAANVVIHTGATPVFADIDPETFNVDPLAAHAAVPVRAGDVHARQLHTVLVEPTAGLSRDALQARLGERRVSTSIHFRALHLYPFYQERFGLRRGMFPVAEAVSDSTLSLPLSAAMAPEAVDRVIEALHDVLG